MAQHKYQPFFQNRLLTDEITSLSEKKNGKHMARRYSLFIEEEGVGGEKRLPQNRSGVRHDDARKTGTKKEGSKKEGRKKEGRGEEGGEK